MAPARSGSRDRGKWVEKLRPGRSGIEVVCSSQIWDDSVRHIGEPAALWCLELAEHSARAGGGHTHTSAETVRLARSTAQAAMLTMVCGLRQQLPASEYVVPEETFIAVRTSARNGSPLAGLIRMIVRSHERDVAVIMEAARAVLAPAEAASEMQRISADVFAYFGVIYDESIREFEKERAKWSGTTAAAQRDVVDRVLRKDTIDVEEAETVLAYPMDGWHIALVLTASRPLEGLDREFSRIASRLNPDQALVLQPSPATISGWLHWRDPPPADAAVVIRSLDPLPGGGLVSVGPPGRDLSGFRWSHLAALDAERLPGLARDRVIAYDEVRVPTLLTADGEHAARMAVDALGPELCSSDPKIRRLRETLSTFLSTGRSRTAAAAALHVSSGTVAYRVRRAEELLGRPLGGEENAVLAALEIVRAFEGVDRDVLTIREGGPLRVSMRD